MTDDNHILRDALIGRLRLCDPGAVWNELFKAGVIGLCVPQELGGLGLSAAEASPVMEALGELCLPTSFLETAVVATGLLSAVRCAKGDEVLRAIALDGARVAVAGLDPALTDLNAYRTGEEWVVEGNAKLVLGADDATSLVVIAPVDGSPSIFVMANSGNIQRHDYPTIDGRTAADLSLRNTSAFLIKSDADEIISAVTDQAIACISIEAAALMTRLVRDTVDYAQHREQFGQAIGCFQAVQHRLVDMNMQARRASAISRRALAALAAGSAHRARLASAAKVTIAQAGRFIGQQAVQLHGGMGMTMELPVGRCFKRLTVIESELGSSDDHLQRFAMNSAA